MHSLELKKHPAIGKPAQEIWGEDWDIMGPLLRTVLETGKPVLLQNSPVTSSRSRKTETAYWTFSYSLILDDEGNHGGVLVNCLETTQAVRSQQALRRNQDQFQNLIRSAPVAIALVEGPQFVVELANEHMLDYLGREHQQVMHKRLFDAIPEARDQGYEGLLMTVYTTGERFIAKELVITLERNGQLEPTYIDFVLEPFRQADSTITGVLVICTEITEQVLSRKKIEEKEAHLELLSNTVPAMIFYLDLEQRYRSYNETFMNWFGVNQTEVIGKTVREFIGEAAYEKVLPHLAIAYAGQQERYELWAPSKMNAGRWLNITYTPHKTADGTVLGIIVHAADITHTKQAELDLRESEARFRALIEQAPIATCLFVGREMRVEIANEPMLHFWGKGRTVFGKPLKEAIPELIGQPFLDILDQVFRTGETYTAQNARAELEIDGVLGTYYFDFTYKPILNSTGEVYGIMDMAIDVTEQVKARQQLEKSEAVLRNAIEMAELATWQIDIPTGAILYSERLQNWLGIREAVMDTKASPRIHPKDRERVQLAMKKALEKGSTGYFDEVYTIINALTGQDRIIHASGQATFDDDGNPITISGTAQDVTIQQELQLALKNEVQIRTEELAAINEELTATNDALAATNAELTESTALLVRSNENLQKFAYVASHDLQEPLRKIQQFGDLLQSLYADSTGDQLDYLQRMQSAASRMSMLIKDLLNFSRISTRRDESKVLALDDVIRSVLTDLDLVIAETGAQIQVDPMPQIKGDPSQMGQLFQNLLSNALKFSRVNAARVPAIPQIAIRYGLVEAVDLPYTVKPGRLAAQYHRIDVADNGIGFDERYLDRIFQVFQRLHGKSEFAGTGVGLAISEKVVTNHGGAITATSQPGKGATFHVYLPN
ncbi:hypothetical protein GCM10028805_46180 [Spirosoma harenae]